MSKKEKKKGKKKKDTPDILFQKSVNVDLPSGSKIKVTVAHTNELIRRRAKVTMPDNKTRNLRDADGNYVTMEWKVRGIRLTLEFENGDKVVARSCCKPPDVFNAKEGIKRALRRIFKMDSGISCNRFAEGGKPIREKTKARIKNKDRESLLLSLVKPKKKKAAAIGEGPLTSEAVTKS
jgi:hypothetical protein